MRSPDGGATWAATDGPPADVTQLVLPTRYPDDPRIFAGVSPYDATRNPYVSAGFGIPFQPLPNVPPGTIALSAYFDNGDPRLFSSALGGIWSWTVGSKDVAHQEIAVPTNPAIYNTFSALATPPPGGPAVLAWAPP